MNRRSFLRTAALGAATATVRTPKVEPVELDVIPTRTTYMSDPLAKRVADGVMARGRLDPNDVTRLVLIGGVWHVSVIQRPGPLTRRFRDLRTRIVEVPA